MSTKDVAVAVRGLSKAYTIAHNQQSVTTIREAMLQRIRNPLGRGDKETFWALRDVDFEIERGDVVGIVGRNGAGKSTLLKILSNITRPTSGYVELFGRVGSLLEVGTGFHLELTGRENIFLNGAILGMRRREIERQFDAIVDFAGVEKFLDTPVKRYSSGMFVRLAFAVAAHLNPDILIVDEVLAVGDAEFQQKCLGKMQDVAQQQGRTILFVSHNEAAVRRLCKSAIFLRSGQVEMIGTPEEAFTIYRAQRSDSAFDVSGRQGKIGKVEIVNAFLTLDGIQTSELVSGVNPVLTLEVEARESVKFFPELMLRDANSTPVMFAPLLVTQGIEYEVAPGSHTFSFELQLPQLASGRYSLDLSLPELGVRFHDIIEEALVFLMGASPQPVSGWTFEQSRGQGCILLKVEEIGSAAENRPAAENAP